MALFYYKHDNVTLEINESSIVDAGLINLEGKSLNDLSSFIDLLYFFKIDFEFNFEDNEFIFYNVSLFLELVEEYFTIP